MCSGFCTSGNDQEILVAGHGSACSALPAIANQKRVETRGHSLQLSALCCSVPSRPVHRAVPLGGLGAISHAGKFSAALLKTSTSRSPAFASSMIFLAITSSVRSPGRLRAARTVSNAMPMSRVVSGSKFWSSKKGLMGTRAPTQRKLIQSLAPLAILTLSAAKPKSELNRHYQGTESMFWYFASSMRRERSPLPLPEACMPKKRPDKQQNQEEPPLSLGRDIPEPAPVDGEAFARRAGEIIANSSTSLHKPKDVGKRSIGAADERRRSQRTA